MNQLSRLVAKGAEVGYVGLPPLKKMILVATLSLLLFLGCDGQRYGHLSVKTDFIVSSTTDAAKPLHATVTVARGEAQFIVEWLNYHSWLGYGRFYIYNQDDDPTVLEQLLANYTSAGLVVLKPWPLVGDQRGSYVDFLHNHAHEVATFTFLDGDEFLNLCKHATVDAFLAEEIGPSSPQAAQKKPSCLELSWYTFGTPNLPFHPPRTAVLTQYFHRSRCPFRRHPGKVVLWGGNRYHDKPRTYTDRHTGTMHHFCREHTNDSRPIPTDVASIYHYSLRNGDLSFATRAKRGIQGDFAGQKMYEGMTGGAVLERNEHRDATMLRILDSVPDLLVARPLTIARNTESMLPCTDPAEEERDCA